MTPPPALQRFMEARSDRSGRASACAGLERCHELSALLDAALADLAGTEPPFTVVAVGGSGRREQCRHSDIDVMLLVPRPDGGEAARCLYPLWDAQLKVGHSVRTVEQAIAAAGANIETFTALLDARYLHGDRALFERFERARRRLVRAKLGWLRRELAAWRTQARDREPWQLMALDLKTSRGGLRDLQCIHWMKIAETIAERASAQPPAPALEAALDRLLATRNAVHALAERPSDVFRPENAGAVGEWLGVDPFEWARDLYAVMRQVDAAAERCLFASPPRRWWPWRRDRAMLPSREDGEDDGRRDLDRLLDVLRGMQPGGPLEPLPPAPWLERLLPEWSVLRYRPHIAPFHVNPVDIHVMRCVAEVHRVVLEDTFDTGTPAIAREFGRPDELLLAAFLHDVGKGHSGDHSAAGAVIAERFAARAGLDAETTHRVVTAVRHHLLLPAVATRRDIADEAVIRETAASIGDADILRLAYVLAVADARASAPNVWSAWKAQLLRTLYRRVMPLLAPPAPDAPLSTIEAAIQALADRFPADVVRAHLEGMGADYRLSTPPAVIGDHLEMIAAGTVVQVRHDRVGTVDRVTLVTRDRPGLLQAIAGTLAGHHASVLGGVAYTRSDGIAIQVWHVGDALGGGFEERRWRRLLEAIPAALEGSFSIDGRLAEVRASYPEPSRARVPTTLHIDNHGSREHTIFEVSTADRRGLLYAITRALHEHGIDIHLAKVDTIGTEVVDAFYIRRANGRRIEDPDEQERLREHVLAAITALDGDPRGD